MSFSIKQIRRLISQGAYREAIEACTNVEEKTAAHFDAQAVAYSALGDFENAFLLQEKAINCASDEKAFLNNLAIYAIKTNRHDVALKCWTALYVGTSPPLEIRFNMALAALKTNDRANAQQHLISYTKDETGNANAWRILADLYASQQALEEALECYDHIIRLNKANEDDYFKQGLIARDLNQLDRAQEAFTKTLHIVPNHIDAHFELAQILLAKGNSQHGFEEFEWRLKRKNAPRWAYFPSYQKGEDITGKKLLIYAEQGAGDTIHFSRYIPLLKKLDITPHLICQPSLVPLLNEYGIDATDHTELPPICDRQCALLSLPYLFDFLNFVPPLEPPESLKPYKSRHVKEMRVGICWSGSQQFSNNHLRSCGFESLCPVFEISEIEWTSLIPGTSIDIAERFQINAPLQENNSYLDTARIINDLDIIITVDTSIAHLSGIMNKETWVLLHNSPDWRWAQSPEKKRLYPSHKLFRQKNYGQWDEIVAIVKEELEARVKHFQLDII